MADGAPSAMREYIFGWLEETGMPDAKQNPWCELLDERWVPNYCELESSP
jgi:hypothetical protein